jgi:hypothetical protein
VKFQLTTGEGEARFVFVETRRMSSLHMWQSGQPSRARRLRQEIHDPTPQSPPGMTECPAIEGFYRHCIANCRLNRTLSPVSPVLAPVATYLMALWFGNDWPGHDGGDPNHASDRAADRAGLLNSYIPQKCADSCLKGTKKAIEQNCNKNKCKQ